MILNKKRERERKSYNQFENFHNNKNSNKTMS